MTASNIYYANASVEKPTEHSASAPPIPTAQAVVWPDNKHEYAPMAPSASAPPTAAVKRVTRTYTIPAPSAPSSSQNIPPGAKPGGVWMKQNYIGPVTGGATVAGCLFFFLPGLLFLCCPMDKRYVYQEPGHRGRLLNGAGRVIKGGRTPNMIPPGHRGMNI